MSEIPIVNGDKLNVKLTNPTLYRNAMASAIAGIFMGMNFLLGAIPGGIIPSPTFFLYNQSNFVWAFCFLAFGIATFTSLKIYRNDRLLRLWLQLSFVYLIGVAFGALQPAANEEGSVQNPILYGIWAWVCWSAMRDPLINQWTAKTDNGE